MFIAPGIYLSCLPHPRSLPFLRDHNVRSALFLTPKPPQALEVAPEVHTWMASIRYQYLETPKMKGSGKSVATSLLVKTGLEYILEAPKPVLISGYDGIETGALIVACLRKLQCWENDAILHELGRSVQHTANRILAEAVCRCCQLSLDALHLHFVNNFCSLKPPTGGPSAKALSTVHATPHDAEATLVLPSDLPDWLWIGHDSPSSLLHGIPEEQRRTQSKESDLLWHPTMRIRQGSAARSISRRSLRMHWLDNEEDSDQDRVSTPRGVMKELSLHLDTPR